MRIVVLAGGNSTEREISIISGTGMCRALRNKGHLAVLVDACSGAGIPDTPFPEDYDVDAAAAAIRAQDAAVEGMRLTGRPFFGDGVLACCAGADIVFLALHGANGEDGRVQACFDLFGIRYTGTGYLGSGICMDKHLTKQILRDGGVPTAPWIRLRREEADEADEALLHIEKSPLAGKPLVVKVNRGGSSVGVYLVPDSSGIEDALREAFLLEDTVIVEEYIAGREFSVGLLDGDALPVIEIAPKEGFYDYRNKYTAGATVETCPADIPEDKAEEMQRYAAHAYELLGMEGYGRLDFLMRDDGKIFCLEANTLPGMTPTSLLPQEADARGMNYEELCEELIRISQRRREA